MAAPVSKSDIVSRFTTRVKDYITANTNAVSGTGIWNTTIGAVTSTSQSTYGGPYNRTTATDTVASPVMATADLPTKIGVSSAATSVVTTLRNFLVSYANNHRITLQNTGNLSPPSYSYVVKVNDLEISSKNAIIADVNQVAISNNMVSGKLVSNLNLDGFIDDCRDIWINRCFNTTPEIFYYGFCHSSCHSNHSSHGSRGRR